jgi:hypothetical protein
MTVQDLGGPKPIDEAAGNVLSALSTYASSRPDAVEIQVTGIVATGTFEEAMRAKAKEKGNSLRFQVDLKYPGRDYTKFIVAIDTRTTL